MKRFIIILFILLIVSVVGCSKNNDKQNERLKIITIHSTSLNKDMTAQVYLPENYDNNIKYPVLYFLPSYGGSSYTVINQFGITDSVDRLIQSNQIQSIIMAALGTDSSFGVNYGKETRGFVTSSGKTVDEGMYEDYIINEAIPHIEEQFNTYESKDGRYIGGYSMGGFAALHIAFRHPDLFSKVGGHSPSLFVKEFPDTGISDWLYPDNNIRSQRDPIWLAQSNDLTGLSVYLDTDNSGVNVEGCQKLYDILSENGIDVEFNLFPGTHGYAYCNNNMDKYLLFYVGK